MNQEDHNQRELVRTLMAVVSTLCLVLLVPLNAWALNRLVELGERQGRLEERFNSFVGPGPRYTADDAARDLGVLTRVLEAQGQDIDDLETRIRKFESN